MAMLENLLWKLFEKTGSITAYILYRQVKILDQGYEGEEYIPYPLFREEMSPAESISIVGGLEVRSGAGG